MTTVNNRDYGDEPVFILRAADNLALSAIEHYGNECVSRGLIDQAKEVGEAYREVKTWREANPTKTRVPSHKHVPVDSIILQGLPGRIIEIIASFKRKNNKAPTAREILQRLQTHQRDVTELKTNLDILVSLGMILSEETVGQRGVPAVRYDLTD